MAPDGNGPLGNVTSYEHDKLGRVTAVTDAMGERTFFTYTAKGEIATVTDAQEALRGILMTDAATWLRR